MARPRTITTLTAVTLAFLTQHIADAVTYRAYSNQRLDKPIETISQDELTISNQPEVYEELPLKVQPFLASDAVKKPSKFDGPDAQISYDIPETSDDINPSLLSYGVQHPILIDQSHVFKETPFVNDEKKQKDEHPISEESPLVSIANINPPSSNEEIKKQPLENTSNIVSTSTESLLKVNEPNDDVKQQSFIDVPKIESLAVESANKADASNEDIKKNPLFENSKFQKPDSLIETNKNKNDVDLSKRPISSSTSSTSPSSLSDEVKQEAIDTPKQQLSSLSQLILEPGTINSGLALEHTDQLQDSGEVTKLQGNVAPSFVTNEDELPKADVVKVDKKKEVLSRNERSAPELSSMDGVNLKKLEQSAPLVHNQIDGTVIKQGAESGIAVGAQGGPGDRNSFLEWLLSVAGLTTTTEAPVLTPPSKCEKCLCGQTNKKNRIVGGQETQVNEYPWMALLLYSGQFYCGGSLLNDRYVLTAAHCVSGFKPEKMSVRLLEHNRDTADETQTITRKVMRVVRHSKYSSNNYDNDIALIRLDEVVPLVGPLRPVCLPARGRSFSGYQGVVTGWGAIEEHGAVATSLQEVTVPIISNVDCRKTAYGDKRITDNMLCAGFPEGMKDSCQGDSGGPLHIINSSTTYHDIVGIVSWGEGCAQPDHPGVYTRVNRYLTWIKVNTKDACYC